MKEVRFLEWKVYKEAKDLFRLVLEIYRSLPQDIKMSIGGQLIRSSLSITLNIAEGSGKESDRELNRFFDISVGSSHETLANLDILHDNGFISKVKFDEAFLKIESITKQLCGFKKKLKNC